MKQESFKEGSEFPPCEKGKIRIYSMRFCPYAQRALLVANAKGIEYDVVNIHIRSKPDWFLELNPDGTVPVFQKDDQVFSESLVVADYLDEVFPEPRRLTSSDPYQRAKDKVLVERFGKVTKVMFVNYPSLLDGNKEKEEEVLQALEWLEKEIAGRATPFLAAGDKVGMVDLMIWPWFERFEFLSPLPESRFPVLHSWIQRMKAEPVVRQTHIETELHKKFMLTCKDGQMNVDVGL